MSDRRATRAVVILCACQAVLNFGLGLAFPFFAIYLHRQRGVPLTLTGAWLSLGVLTTAASQALGGELSDRFGRRRVMVAALWGRAATVLALAAAIEGAWPIPALIAFHLLSSFVAHFFEPAARGWIADHVGVKERHGAYGWLRMATHGGFAAGPALGGLLADRSYAMVFAASAVVCAVCAASATVLLGDDARSASAERFDPSGLLHAARDPRFARLCALNALISVAMAQLVVPLSVYATRSVGLKDSQVGMLLSLNGLLVLLFQIPTTRWLAGVPLTTTLALGSLAYAAGYLGVSWAGGFLALAACVAVVTIGEILVPPAVHALAANIAPERQRGRYLGFFGLSRQLGSAVGPAAGCWGIELAAAHGLSGHWPAVALVGLAAAAGFRGLGAWIDPAEDGMPDVLSDDRGADELALGA